MSSSDLRILSAMVDHASRCAPWTAVDISEEAGIPVQTVYGAMRRLVKANLCERSGSGWQLSTEVLGAGSRYYGALASAAHSQNRRKIYGE